MKAKLIQWRTAVCIDLQARKWVCILKIVFMGTPDFAVKILDELKCRHEIMCVVTQPDKPQGRKKIIVAPPVKEYAENYGIEVLQPERIRNKEFISMFEEKFKDADVFVVAAYGQILSQKILSMAKYGCINVHASLLPKYRGAAPINRAIMDGCDMTGVSIMKMDKGIDTGDVILQKEMKIEASDTGESLYEKMAELGAYALIEALQQIENGTAIYTVQNDALATCAPMLTKETGKIDFNAKAKSIIDLIRALAPNLAAYTFYNGGEVKLWRAEVSPTATNGLPGEILEISKNGILVKTGDYDILIKEVQPESGKRMDAAAFTRGRGIGCGECFGK